MNHSAARIFGATMAVGISLGAVFGGQSAHAEVNVIVDQAKILRLPAGVATVVIGNPSIADISVQRAGLAIVTGKTYGVTNMIAIDAKGVTLSEEQVVVRAASNMVVTVQRGMERETLTCSPLCEKTVKVGDAQANFDMVKNQATDRSNMAGGMITAK